MNTDALSMPQPANRRTWLGFLTILPLVLLVAMDGSVLYLAMPRVTSALSPTADQALWILDIYGFVVGSLLIAFGNIGDRYGRLKLMMAGAVIFGFGSLSVAYSTTPGGVIGFRALMGLGGATLLPSGLAIVSALFPDARQRAQAIGIFAATFAAGFAIGPVIGGLLLQRFEWGAVFLINVPVTLVFLLVAPALLRGGGSGLHAGAIHCGDRGFAGAGGLFAPADEDPVCVVGAWIVQGSRFRDRHSDRFAVVGGLVGGGLSVGHLFAVSAGL